MVDKTQSTLPCSSDSCKCYSRLSDTEGLDAQDPLIIQNQADFELP
jgi:hypothetical protein